MVDNHIQHQQRNATATKERAKETNWFLSTTAAKSGYAKKKNLVVLFKT
jgi:hypothetical protein